MRDFSTGNAALQAQRVRKSFGDHHVLKNVSFTVGRRAIHGLVGLSGAGKSTILNCLVGYYELDAGRVLVEGERLSDSVATRIGFTTQDNCFYEDLSLKENIRYFGDLYGVPRSKLWSRAEKLMKMVRLGEDWSTSAENLSGGMKRRFDLVLSLLHKPGILILDEPATGLDPKLRNTIWEIVEYINQLGVTTIISSHLLNDLEEICSQISLLHNGTIVSTGSPQQLRDLFSHHHRITITTEPGNYKALLKALKRRGVEPGHPQRDSGGVAFNADDPHDVVRAMPDALRVAEERIVDFDVEKPGLESLMEKVA